jgi:hypothetical protein
VCHFLWPFIIVICGIRAILMIVQLNRGKEHIIWECKNGGQLWSSEPAAYNATITANFPDAMCAPGFDALNTAFIIGLLVDLAFQVSTPTGYCVGALS